MLGALHHPFWWAPLDCPRWGRSRAPRAAVPRFTARPRRVTLWGTPLTLPLRGASAGSVPPPPECRAACVPPLQGGGASCVPPLPMGVPVLLLLCSHRCCRARVAAAVPVSPLPAGYCQGRVAVSTGYAMPLVRLHGRGGGGGGGGGATPGGWSATCAAAGIAAVGGCGRRPRGIPRPPLLP